MKKFTFCFIAAVIALFLGCSKINPEEEIPSYITVPYYTFNVDSVNQGTSLQYFTDVWAFKGDEFLGCFPIGAKIPVLAEGSTVIKLRPGIKNAGIASLRSMYPMARFYETTVDLKRGQVQTIVPAFEYYPGLTFLKLESFSLPGTFLAQTPSSDTFLVSYNGPESLPGQGNCAFVYLDATYQVFDAQSGSPIPYQVQGSVCYLEMHYKTNVDLFISVSNGGTDLRLCSKLFDTEGAWKKIYIPLTENLNAAPTLYNFYFVLHASRPANGPDPRIYFDNIKIVRQ